jgi:hypothetical protein
MMPMVALRKETAPAGLTKCNDGLVAARLQHNGRHRNVGGELNDADPCGG